MDPLSKKSSKISATMSSIKPNTALAPSTKFGFTLYPNGTLYEWMSNSAEISSNLSDIVDNLSVGSQKPDDHQHLHKYHHHRERQHNGSSSGVTLFHSSPVQHNSTHSSIQLLNGTFLSENKSSVDYLDNLNNHFRSQQHHPNSDLGTGIKVMPLAEEPLAALNDSTSLNEFALLDYSYELEAVPDPYQTMIETLFIMTSILALFFNISALLLIVTRFRRRRFRPSSAVGRLRHSEHNFSSNTTVTNHTHHHHRHHQYSPSVHHNGTVSQRKLSPASNVNSIGSSRSSLGPNCQNGSTVECWSPQCTNTTTVITGKAAISVNENNAPTLPCQQVQFRLKSSINGPITSTTTIKAVSGSTGKRKVASSQLRLYLINLFVNDIVIALFTTPFSYTDFMYGQWIYPAFLCPITNFISTCAVAVSVYTLIAIGLERYFAIIYPFKKFSCFKRHTKWIIALIWTIGIVLGIPTLIQSRAVPFQFRNKSLLDCRELWEREIGSKVYTGVLFGATFVIPFGAITFLYISIAVQAFRHVIPGNADASRDQLQMKNKIRMVKMLVLLVITFAVCWLPIQSFNMVMWLCDRCRSSFSTPFLMTVYVTVSFVCQWLSIAHSLIDPIIYCFNSRNFKISQVCAELKSIGMRLICCCFCRFGFVSRFCSLQSSNCADSFTTTTCRHHHHYKKSKPKTAPPPKISSNLGPSGNVCCECCHHHNDATTTNGIEQNSILDPVSNKHRFSIHNRDNRSNDLDNLSNGFTMKTILPQTEIQSQQESTNTDESNSPNHNSTEQSAKPSLQ